jgi:SPP1 gp7 family putative phage head morphogenesis protein
MPYSKRQLNRLLYQGGEPFIPAGDLSLSMRVTESDFRRQLYALDDATVTGLQVIWKRAYRELAADLMTLAQQYGVDTLDNSGSSIRFRQAFLDRVTATATRLGGQSAAYVLRKATVAYGLGYFAKAWQLDAITPENWHPAWELPDREAMTRRVLHPAVEAADGSLLFAKGGFFEADTFDPERWIAGFLGREWKSSFDGEAQQLISKVRALYTRGASEAWNLSRMNRELAALMGLDLRNPGVFGRVNALSRTYTIGASAAGSLDLFKQNRDVLIGYQWWTQRDGRQCPRCDRLHAKIWKFDDRSAMMPPEHFNCRCALLPVFAPAGIEEFIGDLLLSLIHI